MLDFVQQNGGIPSVTSPYLARGLPVGCTSSYGKVNRFFEACILSKLHYREQMPDPFGCLQT